MSKLARKPLVIPKGVEVKLDQGLVKVKGPKGELSKEVVPEVEVKVEGDVLRVNRLEETRRARSLQGTYFSLLKSMLIGVSEGFEKKLELVGVGYKAELKGDELVLQVGHSHPITYKVPSGINISAEKGVISIRGIDREKVGQVASQIRKFRLPEPYKGKGIKYVGEHIRRKAGKATVSAGAGGKG